MPRSRACDCAGSARAWEVAGGYRSKASHVRRARDCDADGLAFLGNTAQLCHAFYHVPATPELASHPRELCLQRVSDPSGRKCETKGVVVVAALRAPRGGAPTYLARYSNCPMAEHAEEFLLADEELIAAVDALAPLPRVEPTSNPPPPPHGSAGVLTLYQRLQPCHRSADNRGALWSCSEEMLERLWRRELRPRGVALDVAVAYTYRAHWRVSEMRDARERERYGPAVEAAREGLRVFARAAREVQSEGLPRDAARDDEPIFCGVAEEGGATARGDERFGLRLRALRREDWRFLVSLCAAETRAAFEANAAPFDRETAAHRAATDAFAESQIRAHEKEKGNGRRSGRWGAIGTTRERDRGRDRWRGGASGDGAAEGAADVRGEDADEEDGGERGAGVTRGRGAGDAARDAPSSYMNRRRAFPRERFGADQKKRISFIIF